MSKELTVSVSLKSGPKKVPYAAVEYNDGENSQTIIYKASSRHLNEMFADVVIKHYEEGDVVWCHDYHLMYLPKCLKDFKKSMKVGWFLHTPFPSSKIHRTLSS